MSMTRQEQLDAVVRNYAYGEWSEDFGNGVTCWLHGSDSVRYAHKAPPCCHAFTREEVEARKAELQNKPSWDDAPYWAEYLAQDGNTGYWHWYESKPYVRSFDDEFASRGGIWERCSDGDVIGDWRDTLEKRPESETGQTRDQSDLMLYCPATGEERPYPSEASQWREFHGLAAWLYNPWTGKKRHAGDVGSDVFGHLIMKTPDGEKG